MSISLARLEESALEGKPDITEYMNCGYINRAIATHLEEVEGIKPEVVIGGIWQSRSNREEHCYLRVDADDVHGVKSDVIVDGAISQFCEVNRDDLWVILGPKEDLPEVAVLTRGDEWFEYFRPDRP